MHRIIEQLEGILKIWNILKDNPILILLLLLAGGSYWGLGYLTEQAFEEPVKTIIKYYDSLNDARSAPANNYLTAWMLLDDGYKETRFRDPEGKQEAFNIWKDGYKNTTQFRSVDCHLIGDTSILQLIKPKDELNYAVTYLVTDRFDSTLFNSDHRHDKNKSWLELIHGSEKLDKLELNKIPELRLERFEEIQVTLKRKGDFWKIIRISLLKRGIKY